MNSSSKYRIATEPISTHFSPKRFKNNQGSQTHIKAETLQYKGSQKLEFTKKIWNMNQDLLCKTLLNYNLFPYCGFTRNELVQDEYLKLVKQEAKIYFGKIKNKKKQGIGILICKDGRVYEGEFKDNEKDGNGVQLYANGNIYVGEFSAGKKHGNGTFFWFNLSKERAFGQYIYQYYEGNWWSGLPDGRGTHQKANGDFYVGQFKNGLKHGKGKQQFANGDFYSGEYVNGMPQGYGQYMWQDGSTYKGNMKLGLRNGHGIWKHGSLTRQSYRGDYVLDKKQGYGVYEWQNGWTYKGNFKQDHRQGYGQLYHFNVLVFKGQWQKGEQKSRTLDIIQEKVANQKKIKQHRNTTTPIRYVNRINKIQTKSSKKILPRSLSRTRTQPDQITVKVTRSQSRKRLYSEKQHSENSDSSRRPLSYYKENRVMSIHKCLKKHCGCNEISTLSSTKKEPFQFLRKKSPTPKSIVWNYK